MAIENLEDAVRELYFYQKGTAGGFQTMLFDLFAKADETNKQKLALGFPHQAMALNLYMMSPDHGKYLFKEYGLIE